MAHRVPNPTREDVLAAIAKCDELGVDRFLKEHGYRPSVRFVLRHAGRSYPSKAILGVASEMKSSEFSGGAAHTCRVLQRLGFEIREGKPRGLNALLVVLALSVPFDPPPAPPDLPVEPVAYFASGSNHAGEIRAFADLGHDVGVAARRVGPQAIQELLALAGTDIQVFVDSGAFSERCRKTFALIAPMTAKVWERVLGTYEQLAPTLGDQLHVVAPDRVGCQDHTLTLLARYADRLRALHAQGVHVLLPVQRGAMTQAAFYREACAILGFDAVPALPCKKAATSIDEARAFAAEVQPRRVHLLGMGMRNSNAPAFLRVLSSVVPGIRVQLDAVVISSLSGRTNGPGGTPRAITKAYDVVTGLARQATDALATVAARKYLGIVLALGGAGTLRDDPTPASSVCEVRNETAVASTTRDDEVEPPTAMRCDIELQLVARDATVTTYQIFHTA
jgi:hypothetical protein